MKTNMKRTKKIQFEFTKNTINIIDKLVKKMESTSRADVIKKALRFYEFMVECENDNKSLYFEKDGEKQIIFTLI